MCKLKISGKEKIKDIENCFGKFYPFLKIKFFKSITKQNVDEIDSEKSIDQFLKLPISYVININHSITIAEVEKEFLEKMGLSIQILRKTGNHWIEIALTNTWTLKQQNEEGKLLSIE